VSAAFHSFQLCVLLFEVDQSPSLSCSLSGSLGQDTLTLAHGYFMRLQIGHPTKIHYPWGNWLSSQPVVNDLSSVLFCANHIS